MEQQVELAKVAHVVCLPFPAQGHIKPMLKLAELLSQSNANSSSSIQISFINTEYNQERLFVSHSDLEKYHQSYPNIQFLTFSDSLPPQHPRFAGRGILEFVSTIKAVSKPALRELFRSFWEPPTCIIADMIISSSALEIAKEFQVPLFIFQTMSACATWINFHLHKLLEEGELPVPLEDEYLDKPVTQISGLENVFRYRDLTGSVRVGEVALEFIIGEAKAASQASALIINTFEELEAPMISKCSSFYSKIFCIGPLHCLKAKTEDSSSQASASGGLWEEDKDCLTWLDSKPSQSVIFVSFGSLVSVRADVIYEVWHGLINSGKSFLWVIRPNSILASDGPSSPSEILKELGEKTQGKGLIVSWVPQEKVLDHPAIGGFLTHSGWNSTLESIYAGIPMICWPFKGDQQVNSKCVSDIWEIGFDMKDTCDRSIIATMVRDLLGDKREEIMKSLNKIRKQARQSVMEGGSSCLNVEKLINHIISLVP